VPVLYAVARRQVGGTVPLNLIRRGSMDRPRDALIASPYVTYARLKAPNCSAPSERATKMLSRKFVRLDMA
jgi:hypothetical protein